MENSPNLYHFLYWHHLWNVYLNFPHKSQNNLENIKYDDGLTPQMLSMAFCCPQHKSPKASFKSSVLYLTTSGFSGTLAHAVVFWVKLFSSPSPVHSCTFFKSQVRCHVLQNFCTSPKTVLHIPIWFPTSPCIHSWLITRCTLCPLVDIFPNFVHQHLAQYLKHGTHSIQLLLCGLYNETNL